MSEAKTKTLTCIVCPMGCRIDVQMDSDGKIADLSGNTCKRGYNYAMTEFTDPRRLLTSTVKLENAKNDKFLPVRTSLPIPKNKLADAMEIINSLKATAPIKAGDVICRDFIENGIDLISSKTVE